MANLHILFPDQLSHDISSLKGYDKQHDMILMCEFHRDFTFVKHHKKKIAFILSAMRHFAVDLKKSGHTLKYVKLNSKQKTGSWNREIALLHKKHHFDKIILTEPSEYRLLSEIKKWNKTIKARTDIRPDDRFLCPINSFKEWINDRKQPRMEHFYQTMRKKHSVLMHDNKPIGGKWNYDTENRKPISGTFSIPKPYSSQPDKITQQAMSDVNKNFPDHFGDTTPFHFAVTRRQALNALAHFITNRLSKFGDHQDAMLEQEPWMHHSHLSFYLNCGLLLPQECIDAAEDAYRKHKAPINAAEGFIRQILGWREYVRGIYLTQMPSYAKKNFFRAQRKLPNFYWTANTKMNCIAQCVTETKDNAYAHHIQRLMVLGNFALLCGIKPQEVNEWFLIVYADAYEWVELPNVTGMALFADGGLLASKPYAAGGNYINKMSNYCQNCHFNVGEKEGETACPFNYLYWDFLDRNKKLLCKNNRLSLTYKVYDKMAEKKKKHIKTSAKTFLDNLGDS